MANYPTSISSFTTKNNGDTVQGSHINDLQAEVTAIENALVNGLTIPTTLAVTGNATVGGTLGVTGATTLAALSAAAITGSGLLTVNGNGTHNFSAAGPNILQVTATSTASFSGLSAVTGSMFNGVTSYGTTSGGGSTTHTAAASLLLYSNGAGGLSLAAEDAAGTIRLYTGGTTLRATLDTAGQLNFAGAAGLSVTPSGYYMGTWPTTASAANAHVDNANYVQLVTSLRSAKTDIAPIPQDEAVRVVRGLQGVTYRSAVDEDARLWPGFIADDVEPVTPDLVMYGPNGTLQSVAYDRIAAYLVPMLQHLDARVSQLEDRP
jgi:hypothetical protein